jgi:Porphyromonas-type peptidyl-arginine deiminase
MQPVPDALKHKRRPESRTITNMTKKPSLRRPSSRQLALAFARQTGASAPPSSKIYRCNTPSPVTAVAEFSPMGGVLIAYPGTVSPPEAHIQLPKGGPRAFGIPDELIIRMQQADSAEPVHIFALCADLDQLDVVIAGLSATASAERLPFDPKLIHFVPWDTDSYWTRDYGPWWVQNNHTGDYGIAKHLYTTLGGGLVGIVEEPEGVDPNEGAGIFRPNDDYGADRFSDFLNAPILVWNAAVWNKHKKLPPIAAHNWYFTGLLDVGGNYMVTGDGIIASSYLVATQNELPVHELPLRAEDQSTDPSAAVIDARMKYILEQLNRFMGIHTYHVLTDPSGTYIGHIDCWGKFLAPRKILIAQSEDATIKAAYDKIAESFEQEGFTVYRVLCQDIFIPNALAPASPATTAAYTNSLILNDHVYVPIVGGKFSDCDERALAVYRDAMPGHTIVGILGKPENPWYGTDALHCRTRGVPRDVVNNWLKAQLLR